MRIKTILCGSLLMMTAPAFATTFLCVADVGAFAEDGGNKPASSHLLATPESKKWVLSDESGKWVVKEIGQDYPAFDKCVSEYFCEHSKGFAGVPAVM